MRKTSYVPAPFAPRSTDGSTWATAGTVAYADATYYSDTALALATRYYYRVMATDSASTASAASNIATAVTGPTFEVSEGSSGSLLSAVVVDTEASCAACEVDPITSEDVDLGDGSSTTESGDPDSFSHYYCNPGNYTVTVTANTADGPVDSSSTTAAVTVAVPDPTLSFSSSTATVGEHVGFALHPNFCSDGATTLSEYLLDWGDGTSYQSYASSATEFDHCYAHGGTDYHVEAFLETSVGVVAAEADITVTGSNPITDPGTYSTGFGLDDATTGGPLPATTGDTVEAFIAATMNNYCCSGGGTDPESECGTIDFGNSSSSSFEFCNSTGSHPCEAIDTSYYEDGQYLVKMVSTDGSEETKFATVNNAVPVMDDVPEQVAGSGEPFSVSDNYSNMSAELNPVAFIDWGDGTGPHVATVSPSGGSGTITASTSSAPAPGVYTATLTLYPMGPTGTGGGPTYAVTKTFTLDVWGVKIDNGESNDVLISSADGTQNLQEVTAYFPHPAGEALDLAVTSTDSTEADLWSTASPTSGGTPLIGGSTSTYDFTVSATDPKSKTFWVGATEGDTTAGVLQFNISGGADAGESTSGFNEEQASGELGECGLTGAVADCDNKGSLFGVSITLNSDPNTDVGADGSTAHPYNWLVGQLVDLTATVTGPANLTQKVILDWDTPGNVEGDYAPTVNSAATVDADTYGFATAGGDGTTTIPLKFFWVSTQYNPASSAGPDSDVVGIFVKSWNDGTQTATASLKFNVYSPTPSFSVVQGTAGIYKNPLPSPPFDQYVMGLLGSTFTSPATAKTPITTAVGIKWTGGVATPAPFASGHWNFTQLLEDKSNVDLKGGTKKQVGLTWTGTSNEFDLDRAFPYGTGSPSGLGNISSSLAPFSAGFKGWPTDAATPVTSYDGPNRGLPLPPTNESLEQLDDAFQTYVMYLPPGAQSKWVPLLNEDWEVQATAIITSAPGHLLGGAVGYKPQPLEGWAPPRKGGPNGAIWGNVQNIPGFVRANAEPAWTAYR